MKTCCMCPLRPAYSAVRFELDAYAALEPHDLGGYYGTEGTLIHRLLTSSINNTF